MRIIGGVAKGRKLFAPGSRFKGPVIRPTSDRAREAVFNILGQHVHEAQVLDLFAGTAALGLEALSRGARSAVLIEKHPGAVGLIQKNIDICGFSDKSLLIKKDLSKGLFFLKGLLPKAVFSLVFLDPPYGKGLALKILTELASGLFLKPEAIVVAEESFDAELPAKLGCLLLFDKRCYGEAGFWFYKHHIAHDNEEVSK